MSAGTSIPLDTNQIASYVAAVSVEEQSEHAIFFSSSGCSPFRRFQITLAAVKYGSETFELNSPIVLTLYPNPDGDGWVCEQLSFAILAFGDSMERAAHSFCEDFGMMWREIAEAPDEALTPDALEVKRNLLRAVRAANQR